jgi:hypothetical protein
MLFSTYKNHDLKNEGQRYGRTAQKQNFDVHLHARWLNLAHDIDYTRHFGLYS